MKDRWRNRRCHYFALFIRLFGLDECNTDLTSADDRFCGTVGEFLPIDLAELHASGGVQMRMRYAFVLVLLLAVSGWAQSADRVEIFGGYSHAMNDFTGGTLYNSQTSLNRGWNVSANFRLNRFSQLAADYGGFYLPMASGSCLPAGSSCSSAAHTLMFGPQVSFRSKLTPFAHALFGVALAKQSDFSSLVSNHSFVMALGGGVEYGLTPHFGVRAQADYLQTHFTNGDNQVPFKNNNARISVGLVVRF